MDWVPKTELGRLVKKGKITTMHDALETRLPIREPEIVDILLPEMEDVVLDVNMVQRMTDSGRRVRFTVTVAVGNGDGYVGVASVKGQEVGPTIRKAIDRAKLSIIEIRRGCGSWECGCGTPHTFPFAVTGKAGSVEVTFRPAPRGVSLAVGDIAKNVLTLAGVKDVWGFTKGHTKTTMNYANAVFNALHETTRVRVTPNMESKLNIHTGISIVATAMSEMKPLGKTDEKEDVQKETPAQKPKLEPAAKPEAKSKAEPAAKPEAKPKEAAVPAGGEE